MSLPAPLLQLLPPQLHPLCDTQDDPSGCFWEARVTQDVQTSRRPVQTQCIERDEGVLR